MAMQRNLLPSIYQYYITCLSVCVLVHEKLTIFRNPLNFGVPSQSAFMPGREHSNPVKGICLKPAGQFHANFPGQGKFYIAYNVC